MKTDCISPPAEGELDDDGHGRWKQFALMVAHDLKEPIRNIGHCARLLAEGEDETGVGPERLRHWLVDAAERLECMMDALLQHARVGHEPKQKGVDSDRILAGILQDFRDMIQRMEGSVMATTEMPKVDCGPLGLRLVLQNLIENGLKYHKVGEPPVVRVAAEKTGSGWLFEVTDEGIGMPKGKTMQAFDPFKRFEPDREGLGMGLCHVRQIVEAHGGDIWIESQTGEGTRVAFTIPDIMEKAS